MTRADLRLLPAATCVWALAVLGVTAGTAAAIAGGAVLVALALTAITLAGRSALTVALYAHLGVLVLAGVLLFPALQRHGAAVELLDRAEAEDLVVTLTLRAASDPAPPTSGPDWARGGLQLRGRTVRGPARLGRDQQLLPASLPVLVRAEGEAAEQLAGIHGGDLLRLRGRATRSGTLLVLRATEIRAVPRAGPAATTAAARTALRDQARRATAHLPADEAALVRGMTTGDTAGMGERTEDIMRRAGISHLVAVSGANIALVLAAVLGPLLLLGVRRRPRLAAGAAAMAAYVWLVGDEPSVQRAATMAAPLLAARFAGVRASPVAALALTVALWAVLDPVTAASIGFLLSALATAAILLAAPPLATALVALSGERLPRAAALVLAVPLVAQAACTPVLILLAPEVSLWAVPVNMLVGPLVGPATVLGLLGLVLGILWPPAASALFTLAAGGAHLVLLLARTADALPGARVPVPEGASGVLAAVVVLALCAAAIAGHRLRAVRWAVAALLVALLAPGLARTLPGGGEEDWTVALCAVGQGDALLLRPGGAAREGPTVLVDTGPEPAALRACLDRLGVRRIDLLVLTHPHADHIGGRAALTGARAPAEQWICPLPEARAGTVPDLPARAATTGQDWERDGLRLEVLWPASEQDARAASAAEDGGGEGDDANDCSLALAVTWRDGTRLVTLGDLEPAAQERLAAQHPGRADLVKVAHHGSRHQHPALYDQLGADIALVPVGRENSFGHPTAQTLDLLAETGAQVLRTDVHGTVVLSGGEHPVARSVAPAR